MSPAPKKPAEDETPGRSAGDAGRGGETEGVEAEAVELDSETTTFGKPGAEAEGTAAETTGVDKAGAEAAAVSEPEDPAAPPAHPRRPAPAARRRDQPRAPAEAVIVRAQARYVRSSARKARLVCDNIRGKSVADARAILAFSPRHIAEAWTKLLESAVANAENNHELDGDDLKILAVYADEGPTIKRFRPRAQGRATQIRKRTSHLSIQLTTKGV